MARRYGIINKKYDSRLRRCAVSGLRYYESEMVRVGEGKYIHPKFLDEEPKKNLGERHRRRG